MATNIRCEYCGGNQIYNPNNGMLECEHCGKTTPVDFSGNKNISNIVRRYDISYMPEPNLEASNQYLCSSCGATIKFEDDEKKTRCPSCGDTALTRNESAMYVPDGIIPFSINKNQAIKIFRTWIQNRKFAPKNLKEMARLGKVTGLYVPVWNMNFRITGSYFANVTKLEKVGDDYITWHYPIRENIDKTFLNIMLSANKNIEDEALEGLAPYDTQKIKPYSSEYLFGFSGLNTDLNIHQKYQEEVDYKKEKLTQRISATLKEKYDSIESFNSSYTTRNESFNHIYVPVWANHFTYNGKKYHCYINGQTGQATGRAPKSFWKILTLVLGICAGFAVAAHFIIKLFFR